MEPIGNYGTRDAVPGALRDGVPAGTAVLVRADDEDARNVVLDLLATNGAGDAGAVFLTRASPEAGLAACESRADERWCIGCGDAADPSGRAVSVSGPGAITDIAVAFSRVVDRADERGVERLRVGVDLLDTLLERAEPSRAFRFLHVFSGYVRNRGLFAAAAFDPDAHDGATVRNVETLFDFALTVSRNGDGDRTANRRALSSERSGLDLRSEADGRTG